jgi:hypothetical protein
MDEFVEKMSEQVGIDKDTAMKVLPGGLGKKLGDLF